MSKRTDPPSSEDTDGDFTSEACASRKRTKKQSPKNTKSRKTKTQTESTQNVFKICLTLMTQVSVWSLSKVLLVLLCFFSWDLIFI